MEDHQSHCSHKNVDKFYQQILLNALAYNYADWRLDYNLSQFQKIKNTPVVNTQYF